MNRVSTNCVRTAYPIVMMARYRHYSGGSGTNPGVLANGETDSQAPTATMIVEVTMSGQPARS